MISTVAPGAVKLGPWLDKPKPEALIHIKRDPRYKNICGKRLENGNLPSSVVLDSQRNVRGNCNWLLVTFTELGKAYDWTKGHDFGIRVRDSRILGGSSEDPEGSSEFY